MAAAAPLRSIRGSGSGRQPAVVEHLRDVVDELAAHHAEALAFCAAVRPLASRMTLAMREIGPTGHQMALQLEALLARYERRHQPEDDEPVAAAA